MIRHLELKVGALVAAAFFSGALFLGYLMVEKGVFDRVFTVTLLSRNADGVSVGMPVSYSGIDIGQVDGMDIGDNGEIRIVVRIQNRYGKWIRENSRFEFNHPLIGSGKILVSGGDPAARRIGEHETRPLLGGGDATDIAPIMSKAYAVLDNLDRLTRPQGKVEQLLTDANKLSRRMAGNYGLAGGLLGDESHAKALVDSISEMKSVLAKLDGMLASGDRELFGEQGAVKDFHQLLLSTTKDMERLDAVLKNGEAISASVKQGADDLVELRRQLDESVRKTNQLLGELNKRWPFAEEKHIVLP